MEAIHEKIRYNESGEAVLLGVDQNDNIIAKSDNPASEREVLTEFFKTETGKRFRSSGLATRANAEFIQDRINRLYPDGYTVIELEDTVRKAIKLGDIILPVEPELEPVPPSREKEFSIWAQTATAGKRRERVDKDKDFREWYERESRIQRQGSALTPDDIKPEYSSDTLVEFAEAFRNAPSTHAMRNVSGFRVVPGFQNGKKLTDTQFEQLILLATASRLL